MAKNSNLAAARKAQNNEFYTQLADVEKELIYYTEQFCGKVVLCNCDDPAQSNFWRYFHLNFTQMGLRGLVSTHYDAEATVFRTPAIRAPCKIVAEVFLPQVRLWTNSDRSW